MNTQIHSDSEKNETSKQRKIYLRSEEKFIEVSEEVYLAYYRPAWRIRDREQRAGRCKCTRKNLWQCDGECFDCPFHSSPDMVYESLAIEEDKDLTIADLLSTEEQNPEKIVFDHDLVSALKDEIRLLTADEQRIILYYLSGMTDREIASFSEGKGKMDELQMGGIVCRRTSKGGWVWMKG